MLNLIKELNTPNTKAEVVRWEMVNVVNNRHIQEIKTYRLKENGLK